MTKYDAVIVGSGPNGLAAAIALATSGASVLVLEAKDTPGGGLRTKELTLPGFRHDVCSAIHPMGAAGSFFTDYGVEIEWVYPEIMAAHPFDDGSAGVIYRSAADTATANDAPQWARLFGPLAERWDAIESSALGPALRVPSNPKTLARLGIAALPATVLARLMGNLRAGALFAGVAAHANVNLSLPLTASAGVGLIAAGHAGGWPCVRGGSAGIAEAMVQRLQALGGTIECNQTVRSLADLPAAQAFLFDTTPWQLLDIAGEAIPRRTQRAWRRFRPGNASYKIDYALDGPMPWTNPEVRRAGTVHLGGTWQEIAESEAAVSKGVVPQRPYTLVGQQSIFDDSRAPQGKHTLWAYCHVPQGCTEDASRVIEAQFDRFAPGWRDVVLARTITTPTDFANYNANYRGGAIDGGATDLRQLLFRPDFSRDPYRVADTNLWLCSSSTPPGGGVHGICGRRAAESVLRVIG